MKLLFFLLFFCASCYVSGKDLKLATISYTLWINNEINDIYTIDVTAPVNTTFYTVMEIAARDNPKYVFTSEVYEGLGHYINDIGGHHEDKINGVYWFIYQTPDIPNCEHPPSDDLLTEVGVDYIQINDAENYLFWYKQVGNIHPNAML